MYYAVQQENNLPYVGKYSKNSFPTCVVIWCLTEVRDWFLTSISGLGGNILMCIGRIIFQYWMRIETFFYFRCEKATSGFYHPMGSTTYICMYVPVMKLCIRELTSKVDEMYGFPFSVFCTHRKSLTISEHFTSWFSDLYFFDWKMSDFEMVQKCGTTFRRRLTYKQNCRPPCCRNSPNQGCQIFLDTIYQNGEKYTKLPQHYQMAIKYYKWL
jgi:hypothetical protein